MVRDPFEPGGGRRQGGNALLLPRAQFQAIAGRGESDAESLERLVALLRDASEEQGVLFDPTVPMRCGETPDGYWFRNDPYGFPLTWPPPGVSLP